MATATETKRMRIGPESNGMLIAPSEFDAAEFDPAWRYDLVNGVLIVNPSPLRNERDPNQYLGYLLLAYQEGHPEGSRLDQTLPEETISTGPHRRRADRAIWCGLGRLPGKFEPPAIVVEFVSKGHSNRQRDYETKREEYLAIGVREYWVIDRFAKQMTVFQWTRGKPTSKIVSARQTYTTPLLPGFRLSLGQLLKRANQWEDEPAADE